MPHSVRLSSLRTQAGHETSSNDIVKNHFERGKGDRRQTATVGALVGLLVL